MMGDEENEPISPSESVAANASTSRSPVVMLDVNQACPSLKDVVSMNESREDTCVHKAGNEAYQAWFDQLVQFREMGTLCDVTIACGSKMHRAHRLVLAYCSPYFAAMFRSEMSECRQSTITIEDIDELSLSKLIDFAYTGAIEISVDQVQNLLYASSLLQMDNVTEACINFMATHLHPENCLGVRCFALLHNHTSLIDISDQFTMKYFKEVVASEEFLSVSPEHLLNLISSDDLLVSSEIDVFEAVMRWWRGKSDADETNDLLPKLLHQVRLPLLPSEYLCNVAARDTQIRNCLQCRDQVDQAKNYQLSKALSVANSDSTRQFLCGDLPAFKTRPRKSCSGVIFCVGGRGHQGDPFRSIECYDPLNDRWLPVKDMTSRRRHVGVCAVGRTIFAVGGHDTEKHLSSVEVYNPAEDRWSQVAPMQTSRRGIAVVRLQVPGSGNSGTVYAIGGLDDQQCFNTVERYDPDRDQWTRVADMHFARGGVAAGTLDSYIFACGGNDGSSSLNGCERYDPHRNLWTSTARMTHRRAGAGVCSLDGYLYVMGGFDDNAPLKSVEKYNPSTDEWSEVSEMLCRRGGVGVATLAGKIVAVGGHDGNVYLDSVEVYDPHTQQWSMLASIGASRAGAGVVWCDIPVSLVTPWTGGSTPGDLGAC